MAGADISGKWLIGQSPEAWVQWVLNDSTVTVEEMLSTEFQHISRLSDSLLRVKDQTETFLLLTELQLHPDERMPRRMRAYAALAEEKYHLPVYPVVFYLLPPGDRNKVLPDQYDSEFRGLKAHQDFHVVKAWELEAGEILARRNLALLPFVPLMQGADEAVIRSGAQVLREQPEGEKLETILALFASFVLSTETIQQIVRWNMTVLRESPWYREILQEGIEQGLEQGLEQGIEQGLEQGLLKSKREDILNILRVRFKIDEPTEKRLGERLTQVYLSETLNQLLTAAVQVEDVVIFESLLNCS